MTRKRNRNRNKSREALDVPAVTSMAKDGNEEILMDSGNESSPADVTAEKCKDHQLLSSHCSESIKAWKFYQACILERYHWFLDKRRKAIADDYSYKISQACLYLPVNTLPMKTSELQNLMADELEEVNMEEELANTTFCENLKLLESGKSINELPSVDPHVSLDQVAQFISKYAKDQDNMDCDKGKDMSLSFTGSYCSEDSGLFLFDKTSPHSLGLSSLAEIWKPENEELLSNSFNANSVYSSAAHPDCSQSQRLLLESVDACHQPSIEDDDSAIQAVVYSQQPQLFQKSVGDDFLGFSSLANLSSEYRSNNVPLYQTTTPEEYNQRKSSQQKQDFMNVVSVWSQSSETAKHSGKSLIDRDSSDTLKQTAMQDEKPESGEKKKSRKKKKGKSITASNAAPVKFTDCKTTSNKDQKLLEEVNFGWLKEGGNDSGDANGAAALPTQPPLSFAAIVSTPPKVSPPSNQADNSGSKVMFSTKKSTRKYSKSSSLNKTSLCWTFLKQGECPWGDDCIFAHGKKELRPVPKWFENNELRIQPRKMPEAPHSEPCGNHYCQWRRQFLLKKTALCKLWQSGRCASGKEQCQFAHGQSDLQPLPKYEMCRLHLNGKCKLKTSECVYAHSKDELKASKKQKKVSRKKAVSICESAGNSPRLRTISETSTASNDSWCSVGHPERIRTISGTSIQSIDSQQCDLQEFDWLAWDSQYEVPKGEELDDEWNQDECVICAFDFTEENPKFTLGCEHETFHQKCISQWILNKDKSCPICRHPVNIADPYFKALILIEED